jgi:hypothetical protein
LTPDRATRMFVIVKRSDQKAITQVELSENALATMATFDDELLAEMKAHELLCRDFAGVAEGEQFVVMPLSQYQKQAKALTK